MNWKTTALRFSVDGKHFDNGLFENDDHLDNDVTNPDSQGCTQAFLPPVIVAFSNFFDVVWRENICCAAGVKTPFSNF